jgi:hypothetical protein
MLKQSKIQGYLCGLHAVWQMHKNTSEEPTTSELQTAVRPSKNASNQATQYQIPEY